MNESLAERFASQVAKALSAFVDHTVTSAPSDTSIEWWSAYELSTRSRRPLLVGVAKEHATKLALLLGAAEGAEDTVLGDAVLGFVHDVTRTLAEQSGAWQGLTARALEGAQPPTSGIHQTYAIRCGDQLLCEIACWEAAPSAMTADQLPVLENLGVILDIELPLTVRFGESEMTLQSICGLGPGSVVDLGRTPDEPVDVLVNGRLVARGDVIVVSGNYGVRITEVLSAAERIQTMGR